MKRFSKPALTLLPVIIIVFVFGACSKDNGNSLTPGISSGSYNYSVDSNITYGSNTDLQGINVNLKLDVYIPKGSAAGQTFPFVFFVHGGGFIKGDKSTAKPFMEAFAAQGYACASIDYRLDSSLDDVTDPCTVDSLTTDTYIYMAIQDAKAAMRYMVTNAAAYSIDTSKMFFDGNSAGAVTILNAWFTPQSYFNTSVPGIEAKFGGLDNADNSLTNSFRLIGIAANSGALPTPGYITSSNVVPIIYFHGGIDSVIPINHGTAHYCPNSVSLYGSQALYNRTVQLGVSTVLHVDPAGGHGPYTDDFLINNELCFFKSVLDNQPEKGSYTSQASSCQ